MIFFVFHLFEESLQLNKRKAKRRDTKSSKGQDGRKEDANTHIFITYLNQFKEKEEIGIGVRRPIE